jgi:hypothetical protein
VYDEAPLSATEAEYANIGILRQWLDHQRQVLWHRHATDNVELPKYL